MQKRSELFPALHPAVIRVYGKFDQGLMDRFTLQIREASKRDPEPDGWILLIDSDGGRLKILWEFVNLLRRFQLPCMGFVEGNAMSCGADLLLACQYRVASPGARILFHHGSIEVEAVHVVSADTAEFIIQNCRATEQYMIEVFVRETGVPYALAEVIYRADCAMPASRALELGVIHEITHEVYRMPFDVFRNGH